MEKLVFQFGHRPSENFHFDSILANRMMSSELGSKMEEFSQSAGVLTGLHRVRDCALRTVRAKRIVQAHQGLGSEGAVEGSLRQPPIKF